VTFVDSSYWIAQVLPRDRRHEVAKELESTHAAGRLITSNAVLGETWTYLRSKRGHAPAIQWLDQVKHSQTSIERIDAELEDDAWSWLRVHDERPYSFVDATSFALMRKLRIREALAFDGDFAAAGFVELRP
jgi:predicted nucleic acid-binding protein